MTNAAAGATLNMAAGIVIAKIGFYSEITMFIRVLLGVTYQKNESPHRVGGSQR